MFLVKVKFKQMKKIPQSSISFQKFTLFILIIISGLYSSIYAQKKEKLYRSEPVKDAFVLNAVSVEEMTDRAKHHPFVQGEIVVAVAIETSKEIALSLIRDYSWTEVFGNDRVEPKAWLMTKELQANQSVSLVHLSLPDNLNVFEAMHNLEGKPGILWSSPNFYFDGDPREIVPNDPSYATQYHHPLMKNNLAWDITYGSADIMIGITDDGVELAHTDLSPNIWVNPGEIAGNGIDDDNNGYIDDVNGWDFSSGNNDPNPDGGDSHGTHVAGISAARTNNSIGISGVSGHSTILPLQFYGVGSWTAAVINATFVYAADNGANIVNTSYNINGWVGDPVFTAGMQYMHDAGVLHFNSAGNGSELNPARQAFHQTLLTVNTDASDIKSSSSNYGTGVDICAPGSSIYATVPTNSYGYKSGTSMAAPNAAGAAALIWSANPTWNSYQVAAQLLATADNIDAANPSYVGLLGAGRVNTYAAMITVIDPPKVKSLTGMPDEGSVVPPDAVTDFTVSFSQIMDPVTVNNIINFEMTGAGPDDTYGTTDDINYTVSTSDIYMLGTNQMKFDITGPPFINGLHRLMLVSGGLADAFGTPLDGDESGTAGEDFIRNFTIGIPPPIADFTASNTSPVPGSDVIFTDLTYGGPSAWTWTITPTTFSFVNGTDANSQNPEVQFADFGLYSVTLDVSNVAGSDSETKLNYINVISCVYCATTYTNQTDDWISNVSFNTIDNSSGTEEPDGYADYTAQITIVDPGSSHTVSVDVVVNGPWVQNTWVWIDWNQNCNFTDLGEAIDLGETPGISGTFTLSSSITIPADALAGITRMRVAERYSFDPESCTHATYGEVEDYSVEITGGDIVLALTVMLEGPFDGTGMRSDLNTLLPLSQPFNMPPWNYSGTESVGTIPGGEITEWVLVDLRDAIYPGTATSGTSIAKQAAFILNDGSIVGLDGFSNLEFPVSISQNLYVVIWQRNHIGIMSNNAVTPSGGVYSYNFSSGMSQAYGGSNGHKEVAPGIWAMFAADGNSDGTVNSLDESPFWENEAGEAGYLNSDYNLNGQSENLDKDDYWVPNIGKGSQVPE